MVASSPVFSVKILDKSGIVCSTIIEEYYTIIPYLGLPPPLRLYGENV